MFVESIMPSNHFILCHSLFLLPSIFRRVRVLSNKSALCIRWPKYWSFSFSISSFNEYSGLISFRIDWFEFALQGTLKSVLQHHSLKVSVLWCSAFFLLLFLFLFYLFIYFLILSCIYLFIYLIFGHVACGDLVPLLLFLDS